MSEVYLLSVTPHDGPTEYLESVSRTATTWTTDPGMAVHFPSRNMVPITTVYLRFPMLEPLKESATQSEQVCRNQILKWFEEHQHENC